MDAAEEVGGEPVVAGGEAAAVLEPAEHAFDGVSALDLPPQKWTGLSRSAFGLGGADIAQC